jgi:hypothetical protein
VLAVVPEGLAVVRAPTVRALGPKPAWVVEAGGFW